MKENIPEFNELKDNQRRVYIDAVQVYEAHLKATRRSHHYLGSMYWKKAKGHEYLFRLHDRYGNGRSLGRRSSEAEKLLEEFKKRKREAKEVLASIGERLKEQARFCKAVGIQRVPNVLTGILRLLESEGLLGRSLMIVGTNALYAYEADAGVRFVPSLTSTQDMDILWDTQSRLSVLDERRIRKTGLIRILRRVDKSFRLLRSGGFRAVNRDGYRVDLLKPIPRPPWKQEPKSMGRDEDLQPAEVRNLDWLLSSPKFSSIVIGEDGFPATMVAPDPRSFALHKLWLSQQEDREPTKKPRDRGQALAVARLVVEYLPQHRFELSELRMFPKEVAEQALEFIKRSKLPVGFDSGA